jgi:hypothetical protein
MNHHPIAQIALNGNLKSQEIRPRLPPFPAKSITLLAAFPPAASTLARFFTDYALDPVAGLAGKVWDV